MTAAPSTGPRWPEPQVSATSSCRPPQRTAASGHHLPSPANHSALSPRRELVPGVHVTPPANQDESHLDRGRVRGHDASGGGRWAMPPCAAAVPFGRGVPERADCRAVRRNRAQLGPTGGDRTPGERLLVPELRQAGRPLLYSFRDVIALRTFVYLRGEHSLQKVRKAVSTLRTSATVTTSPLTSLSPLPAASSGSTRPAPAPTSSEATATGFSTSAWPTSSPSSTDRDRRVVDLLRPASCSASIPSCAAATRP